MSKLYDKSSFRLNIRQKVLSRIKGYGETANDLSGRVRQQVFGQRVAPSIEGKPESLVTKIRNHRLVQRREVFRESGGKQSGIALYANKKARSQQL